MKETLEKINANQEKIASLLLQMTHGGNGPSNYANKEASGSHGVTRHYDDQDIHYHVEGQRFGGRSSRGASQSRVTPRPYMPTFFDGQP